MVRRNNVKRRTTKRTTVRTVSVRAKTPSSRRAKPLTGMSRSKSVKLRANWRLPNNILIAAGATDHINITGNTLPGTPLGTYITAPGWNAGGPSPGYFPAGMSTWQGIYDRYVVTGSKIKVSWIQTAATSINEFAISCRQGQPDVTIVPDLTNLVENRFCKRTFNKNGSQVSTLSMYMTPNKFFGIPRKTLFTDFDYSGDTNDGGGTGYAAQLANPDNQFVWDIMSKNVANGAMALGSFALDVEITYYVTFTKPRLQLAN